MAEDGRTYERTAILEWLAASGVSPVDPEVAITAQGLRPNVSARETVEELVEARGGGGGVGRLDDATIKDWLKRKRAVDLAKAQALYDGGRISEAAKLGLPVALGEMASRSYERSDYVQALEYATAASEQGDVNGTYVLAVCRAGGLGCEREAGEALRLYDMAAERGHVGGMLNCGRAYSAGVGCEKDDGKAASFFERAADLSDGDATNEVANCYYEGAGIERDMRNARRMFARAAALETSDGDVNLGAMMICGEGGLSEVGVGFLRIEKAARDGNEIAISRLAKIVKEVKKWKKAGVYKLTSAAGGGGGGDVDDDDNGFDDAVEEGSDDAMEEESDEEGSDEDSEDSDTTQMPIRLFNEYCAHNPTHQFTS